MLRFESGQKLVWNGHCCGVADETGQPVRSMMQAAWRTRSQLRPRLRHNAQHRRQGFPGLVRNPVFHDRSVQGRSMHAGHSRDIPDGDFASAPHGGPVFWAVTKQPQLPDDFLID